MENVLFVEDTFLRIFCSSWLLFGDVGGGGGGAGGYGAGGYGAGGGL